MPYPNNTIKLNAAREIFFDVDIQEILINGKVAGYKANYKGRNFQDTGLTNLCKILWCEQHVINRSI